MSRIGNKPIEIPAGVTVDVGPGRVTVNGPKGELTQAVDRDDGRSRSTTASSRSRARPTAASTAPCTG